MTSGIEACFLPYPDEVEWKGGEFRTVEASTRQKVCYYVLNAFRLIGEAAILPWRMAYWIATGLASRCISLFRKAPEKQVPLPADPWLPEEVGLADSLFQTSGLGTHASATPLPGVSTWNKWLDSRRIEGTEDGDFNKFFLDVLGDPDPYVNLLKEMNCTAHRVSLEWSVIEPEPGKYNEEAIQLYRNLFQKMIDANIKPCVTLHHFVHPQWFEDLGGFDGENPTENIDRFVNYSLNMMEIFPEVDRWMPFNEFGVYGMQSFVRGVYPPGKTYDVAAAGRAMRNMLIAHCKIYQAAKQKEFGSRVRIGSSHQWLNFLPKSGNPLEKLICHVLSVYHKAVYGFLKDGHFALQLGGKANVHLTIPKEEFEKNNKCCDFVAGQWYGFPLVMAGFNGFKAHPGYKVINIGPFSFGSTCEKGGKMMSFGPSVSPDDFETFLQELETLEKDYIISESGCDAKIQKFGEKEWKIDNETQRECFERIFEVLSRHSKYCKGYYAWTGVRKHLEWDRGEFPCLGLVDVIKDKDRRMIGHHLTPAAEFIRDYYGRYRQQQQQQLASVA